MKQIIVKGRPELRCQKIRCEICGCVFKYTHNEIHENKNLIGYPISVQCPWCYSEIKCPTSDEDSKTMLQLAKSALSTYGTEDQNHD